MRFKVAIPFFDEEPKNVCVITPTFRHQTWQPFEDPLPVDVDALMDDLHSKLTSLSGFNGRCAMSVYDVETPKPNYPIGHKVYSPTSPPNPISVVPEAAVCLSFYGDVNRPRHRGRLYLPAWLLGATHGDMEERVGSALRTLAGHLVDQLASVGGGNVDWGVWSGVDHAFHKATNWFVTDSWATVRSRGLAESARTEGTTSG